MDEHNLHAAVLVAVLTRPCDLERLLRERWYRIPVAHAPQLLAAELLALYLTAAFAAERWSVRYLAPIQGYRLATRRELLPDEPGHPRADEQYYRLELGPVERLLRPVPSRRLRRITFISTSLRQLLRAADVSELWHPPEPSQARAAELWGAGIGSTRRRLPPA